MEMRGGSGRRIVERKRRGGKTRVGKKEKERGGR